MNTLCSTFHLVSTLRNSLLLHCLNKTSGKTETRRIYPVSYNVVFTTELFINLFTFLVDFNRIVVGESEEYINAVAVQVGHVMYMSVLIHFTFIGVW